MKKGTIINRIGVITALVTLANISQAQFQVSGHYPAGAESIRAASLPPPGLYLRDYNIFYTAPINKDSGLSDFNATAYIQAPRIIYMTDWNVLGANYGLDLLVPFYYADVKVKNPGGVFRDSTFALGDLQFEPLLLSWHMKHFDISAGYAFWAPSGDSDKSPLTPSSRFSRLLGKGYWGHMLTLGGTWFPDEEKTWALSILNRYEINHENEDWKITPGQEFTLEWGASKALTKNIEVGLVGYYQQQTTGDYGTGVAKLEASNYYLRDRVVGVGPAISTFCPKLGLFTSLAYYREFCASDGPEGNKVTLIVTKRW